MAKDYKKGADYIFLLRTGGSYASPTWTVIKAIGDISVDPNPDDVVIPERGSNTGHLNGEADPTITFRMFEDAGDLNVETIAAAVNTNTMVHIAIARGNIATTGTKWFDLECILRAPLDANRGDPSGWEITAQKHANSDNNYRRNTT